MPVGRGKKEADEPAAKKGVPDVAPVRLCCAICGTNQLKTFMKRHGAGWICKWH